MRIAYVSDVLTIHDYRFLQKLSASEHQVYLITYYHRREIPEDIRSLLGLEIHHEYYRIYAQRVDNSSYWSELLALAGLCRCYQHFRHVLREVQPDLIHAGWVQTSGMLTALSGFHPFLLMPWGSDVLINPGKSPFHKWVTRFVLRRADMITTDSETVKGEIIRLSGYPAKRITVFPWGIDLRRFQPSEQGVAIRKQLGWEDKLILIMTRSFHPVYALDDFLRSLPRVIALEPRARAILVGSGPLEGSLRHLASELGLSAHVHFAGFVPNELVADYLNAADLYVSSSLSDGTSLCLLEAMACALPVVVTDVPSYFEWIEHGVNGWIVPRRNPDKLAEGIVHLLARPELRAQMGQRNLLLAQERADWEKNYAKLEGMYAELYKGARSE